MKNAWQKFNDWIDPKFGVHVFWIVPCFLIIEIAYQIAMQIHRWKQRRHINKILKDNPDINELSKLSGIKNGKRKTD